MASLNELTVQRDALKVEAQTYLLRNQIKALAGLREAWSAADEGYETARDSSQPTGNVRGVGRYAVRRGDDDDGVSLPYYQSEDDLLRMLANVRNLATFDAIYLGAGEALNSYTMGGEWSWTAEASRPDCPPELVQAVQKEVDKFIEFNDFVGEMDMEIHDATREDGETLVTLHDVGSQVRCEFTRPEYICEPQNKQRLDEYAECDVPSQWFFGVHVGWNQQLQRWDRANPLGYHCVYDGAGNEWQYVPTWPQSYLEDLRCGTLIKRNTGRHALRGVSDYWPVWQDLEGNFKLHRGVREGATLQSYIAYIVKHAEGATRQSVEESLDDMPLLKYQPQPSRSGSRTRRMAPGQIIHTDEDQQYQAAPMGSLSQPVFIDVAQFGLRRLSVRWNMPEYLISGDASNANYASTLAAGSPFVKARQRDQSFYRRRYRTVMMKMLRMRQIMGAFDAWVSDWGTLCQLIDVQAEAPDVDIQDVLAQTQRRQLLHQAGVLDAQTWAALEELDPEKVTAAQQAPQEAPSGEMAGLGRRQWQNNTKAIDDVLQRLIGGKHTEAKARTLLAALGVSPQNVDALIVDAKDGVIDAMPGDECECQEESLRENCGIGEDGFKSGNDCAGGGSSGGSSKPAKKRAASKSSGKPPSEKKPTKKKAKKLTIKDAQTGLAKKGFTLEKPLAYDLKTKQARYQVKTPSGETIVMTSDDIKSMLSESARFELAHDLLWEGYP